MCLCKIVVFTFSNKNAFKRLKHKLNIINTELEYKCYPEGTAYIVKNCRCYTPEERDRLPYEMLLASSKSSGLFKTEHIHFCGWKEYEAMRKQVGKQDVFGRLEVKVS